ncbi:MAG: hypothetical protein ABSB52_07180 [Acidimicrobiales bacterium]|jgi:hypothetical protein
MRFFIEDSVDISCPFESVRGRFAGDGAWFAPLASAAEGEGEELYLRVGPSWASGRVQREIRVIHGPARDLGVAVVVPVSWQASALPALFPILEGEVELLPLYPERCRVSLFAFYEPPFGQLGGQLNRALLHRVAQATARCFLGRVLERLEAENPGRPAASRSQQS